MIWPHSPHPGLPRALLKQMHRVSDLGGSHHSKYCTILAHVFESQVSNMCIVVYVCVFPFLSVCHGEWWYLPSLCNSPPPPHSSHFALSRRKEKPFQTQKRQLWHCQAASQQVNFPRSKRGVGERSPKNQFYKLEVPTSPSLEALLEREVGEEEVKRVGQRNILGDPTFLHTPPLQDLGRERLFVATVLREEREGREEVTKMAFPPSRTVCYYCSLAVTLEFSKLFDKGIFMFLSVSLAMY